MELSNNRLLTVGLVLVLVVAIVLAFLVYRRGTASPYAEVTPQRAEQARQRVEAGRKAGPPGFSGGR